MTIDRRVVAEQVRQLRATLPAAGDLLVGLQRVTEATRAVVRVDGAGLTLVHEDGRPSRFARGTHLIVVAAGLSRTPDVPLPPDPVPVDVSERAAQA